SRVRASRHRGWPARRGNPSGSGASQCPLATHRHRFAAGRQCNSDRICALVPRPWRPRPHELGFPNWSRPRLPKGCLVAGDCTGRRNSPHGSCDQPGRRGPQRRTQPEAARPMRDVVLAIENLSVALPSWADRPLAVDGVSLEVLRNEILCVVGESGSGKSVMAKSILRLLPAPHVRVSGGRIMYEGKDLLTVPPDDIPVLRGGRI